MQALGSESVLTHGVLTTGSPGYFQEEVVLWVRTCFISGDAGVGSAMDFVFLKD